jgi:hypothetical protein
MMMANLNIPRLYLTKHYSFTLKISNKEAITEMYLQIPWQLVADPLGSAENALGTKAKNLHSVA